MTTESLLKETPASEMLATMESMGRVGITRAGLKKIRSNPEIAEQIAKLLVPTEYKPLSIIEQVQALQKIPAFASLDAAWVLNEAEAWYHGLTLPDWVESPLVYVWYESLGGYHTALELVLKAIAMKYNLCRYYEGEGQLTPERLRQYEATREAERKLRADQSGDFLIVPSQAGDRWGNYSVKEVRDSYDDGEFGLGSVAEGCRVLSRPNYLVRLNQLNINCAGDEFDYSCAGHFIHTPYFIVCRGVVQFLTHKENDHANNCFGSPSGFVPQS